MRFTLGSVGALALTLGAGCVGPNPNFGMSTETSTGTTEGSATTESSTTDVSTDTSFGSSTSTTDASTSTTGELCGNGELDEGEECDEGDLNGSEESVCGDDCIISVFSECGNGILEPGEVCDDNNTENGDGCDEFCDTEPPPIECGNGIVELEEDCDDGNNINDDECTNECTLPPVICGDGQLDFGEQCDDGNTEPGDGCDAECQVEPKECLEAESYPPCDQDLEKGPMAPLRALGLNCTMDPQESVLVSNPMLMAPDPLSWQVAEGLGLADPLVFSPTEGESFLMLSTGTIMPPNGQGVVVESYDSQAGNHANGNPDDDNFLPDMTPADDDSGTLPPQWEVGNGDPNDKIWFSFSAVVPPTRTGFSVDFVFQSSEWPQWLESVFIDIFVIWIVTDSFTGNLTRVEGAPPAITSLHHHWTDTPYADIENSCASFPSTGPGYSCDEPQLLGTGFEQHASTTWLRLNHELQENTPFTLFFYLSDMGDSANASQVLLDRFRWRCDECIDIDDELCKGVEPDLNCCGLAVPMK